MADSNDITNKKKERQDRILSYMPQASGKKLPTSQQYVEQMQKLASDPTYTPEAETPEERKSLANILQAAQDSFDEAQTRAEWLDVAQTLGRALTQFGAAQQGMRTGSDMSQVSANSPTINMGDRIRAAANKLESRQKSALSQYGLNREAREEARKSLAEEYRNINEALEAGRRTAAAREQDEQSMQRALRLEQERDKSTRPDYVPAKMRVAELDNEQKLNNKQLTALRRLAADEELKPGMSAKSIKKLQEKYSTIAADAGLNLSEIFGSLGEAGDGPAFRDLLSGLISQKESKVKGIAAEKQKILANPASVSEMGQVSEAPVAAAPTTEAAPAPSAAAPQSDVITEEMVRTLASDNGIPLDQARGILIRRQINRQKKLNSKSK